MIDGLTLDDINARMAEYAQAHPRSRVAKGGVQRCPEWLRIDALPRRAWGDDEILLLIELLTAIFKTPNGTQTLRPIQAIALYEIAQCGGAVLPIRVGAGKTLVSFLAPRAVGAERPLLTVPAKLREKTERELWLASEHWRVADALSVQSYEWLGRVQASQYLDDLRPDFIALDEAHKVRNPRAAVTRRIKRYVDKHTPRVVAMSGTLINKRLTDWAHISAWALREQSPAPKKWGAVTSWGASLDLDAKNPPGVLELWQHGEDETVRQAYRRRVIESPGVVATTDGLPGLSLIIEPWDYEVPTNVGWAIRELRNTGELPDGWPITCPLAMARAERQLSLGCYYRWTKEPPQIWLEIRKAWGAFVRHTVRHSRNPLDSEKDVALACTRGDVDSTIYDAWRAVRDIFKPVTEYMWLSDEPVKALIESTRKDATVIWTESVAVGQRLEALGVPYYGRGAKSTSAGHITKANQNRTIAASIDSLGEGLNELMAWWRLLIATPPKSAVRLEQMIGRHHRDGQDADEVFVRVALLSDNHRRSWAAAIEHARFLKESTGQEQKLLQATMVGACAEYAERFNDEAQHAVWQG